MTENFKKLLATMLRTTLVKNSKMLEPAKIVWSTNWSTISFPQFKKASLKSLQRSRPSQLLLKKSNLNLNQSQRHNLNNLKRQLRNKKNLK